jgi:hypothetical protein
MIIIITGPVAVPPPPTLPRLGTRATLRLY